MRVELERSNADLERFAYVASHDLSEPLRAISAFAGRLAASYRGQLGTEADDAFDFILDGTERMRELIQALLAYSRLNRAQLRLERINTKRMVDHVVGLLTDDRPGPVRIAPLPTIVADRTQLGQVFQNLIGNALKFVGEDEPRVEVTAEREERAWRFSVADNGIGVDPQYAETIFEAFERLQTSETYPGAGIGLSICKRAVERHGGEISVAPRPEGGTVFSFTIPDAPE